ncbi:MAG: hypothetical protein ACRCZF_04885, partial [Gemmataceae bacterium]
LIAMLGAGMFGFLLFVGVGLYFVLRAGSSTTVGQNNNRPVFQGVGGGDQPQTVPVPAPAAPGAAKGNRNAPNANPAPAPVPAPGPAAGAKVTLSNARWDGAFGSFAVDYRFNNGQRPFGGRFSLKFKGTDGNIGSADMHFLDASGTAKIHVIGAGFGGGNRGSIEIWMEEGGFPGAFGPAGTKISNSITLN